MCTSTGQAFTGLSMPWKSVASLNDRLDLTVTVLTGHNTANQTNQYLFYEKKKQSVDIICVYVYSYTIRYLSYTNIIKFDFPSVRPFVRLPVVKMPASPSVQIYFWITITHTIIMPDMHFHLSMNWATVVSFCFVKYYSWSNIFTILCQT